MKLPLKKISIDQKPQDVEEYLIWLKNISSVSCSDGIERRYESNISKIKEEINKSELWQKYIEIRNSMEQEYQVLNDGYDLFAYNEPEKLFTKEFTSVIDKTYRKNIVNNSNFPEYPEKYDKWLLPCNAHEELNDTIRTTIVVKYLDGVIFVLEKLKDLAKTYSIISREDFEAKDEGYYAVHLYLDTKARILNEDWEYEDILTRFEIQITTQIQDTIKKLTHKYYDDRRSVIRSQDISWRWKYEKEEFSVNYMGHVLHYLEGLIMEIRNKKRGDNNGSSF